MRRLAQGLIALFSRRRADAALDAELRAFLDESIAAKVAAGMPRAEAERAARIELGSPAAVREWTRDVGWESRLESLWLDVRYGVRSLRRAPGFTAVAVLTVALGIGTNLAIFTLADGMLFRSLPYGQADELVLIQGYSPERMQAYNRVWRVAFDHLQAHHTGLAGIAAVRNEAPLSWAGADGPEMIPTASGTPNLFDVLRVDPYLGRPLRPGDELAEPRPMLLTFGAWRRRFGSDPSIVGRIITFDHGSMQVVGVLPPRFMMPVQGSLARGEVVFAKALDPQEATDPRAGVWSPVARLKPGISMAQAQSETDVLIQQVAQQYPSTARESTLRLANLQFALFEVSRPLLWLLVAAAGSVLLITCVNLANLLLARGAMREREIGIRAAIGASRGRLARQVTVESIMLGLLAGFVALMVAFSVADLLAAFVPPRFQVRTTVFEPRTVGFTLLVSVVGSILFGLGPALHLAGADPNISLREPRRSGQGRTFRTGPALVTIEVALSVMLLGATALTAHSLVKQRTIDLGFVHKDVVSLMQGLPPLRYRTPEQAFDFQQRLLQELRRLPGVTAGVIDSPQVGSQAPMRALADGTPVWSVLPGYFATMGIPLVEGRDFFDSEFDHATHVTIVTASVARDEWPGQSAVGQTLVRDKEPPLTVVGVAADVRSGYGAAMQPGIYRLISPQTYRHAAIVARGPGDPETLAANLQVIVRRLDPGLIVARPQTLRDTLFLGIRDTQFQTMLFALFGVIGVLVSAIGIYGVMAHWVNARTRELGVRLALGADPGQLKALVVRQAAVPLVVGLSGGLAGALVFGRHLRSLLYELTPQDPLTLGVTAITLLVVGLVAAYLPARRAARVDPLVALRAE